MVVAENAFKMDALRPSQTTFNFTDADALVAFAEQNGMAVRGHTLVWHSQLPGWLTGGNFTRDQTIAIMRTHIQTVMARYQGRIVQWDVVNEAVADGTGQLRTDSFWYQRIGPDYIALAFQFAREADPTAALYYNDYEAEGLGQKSDAVFNLVSGLRNQGVPVDGVGWQMHKVNPFRIQSQHVQNAQRLAALGVDVAITEMDVRIALPSDATELQQQALAYGDAVALLPGAAELHGPGALGLHGQVHVGAGRRSPASASRSSTPPAYQAKPAYTALQQVLESGAPQPPGGADRPDRERGQRAGRARLEAPRPERELQTSSARRRAAGRTRRWHAPPRRRSRTPGLTNGTDVLLRGQRGQRRRRERELEPGRGDAAGVGLRAPAEPVQPDGGPRLPAGPARSRIVRTGFPGSVAPRGVGAAERRDRAFAPAVDDRQQQPADADRVRGRRRSVRRPSR
jgi:endo-1,4-beta-xylanase